jgi:hypothetical protein
MKIDALITSVPWTDTDAPLMAPAVLKSSLVKNNFSAVAIDINAEVRDFVLKSPHQSSLIKFFTTEQIDPDAIESIDQIFNYMTDRILSYNSKWVALSLLTYLSQIPTKWLCFHLKQKRPDIKIVVGGPGCFNSLKSIDTYLTNLKAQQLIDHYITGDGEHALFELINGNNQYPGVDSSNWKEIKDLDNLPFPDYDDYNFSLYRLNKVSIWGSRGCVRDCTFCDIHEHWHKFQWRTAESIVEEIIYQHKRYGINLFHFADSLVNGNQKEYRKFIRLLSDYNLDKSENNKIKWSGFFIFRPKEQMREEDWYYTAQSGAMVLAVGVESFVEHIRYHLKKPFSNIDLDYGLQMGKKYNIGMYLLAIVGYVTETQQDHLDQLQWIKDNKHYADNPVLEVQIGSTLGILPGTWLHTNHKELGVELASDNVYQDLVKKDINNTPIIRMQRHEEIQKTLNDNGFRAQTTIDNHQLIEHYINRKYAK